MADLEGGSGNDQENLLRNMFIASLNVATQAAFHMGPSWARLGPGPILGCCLGSHDPVPG